MSTTEYEFRTKCPVGAHVLFGRRAKTRRKSYEGRVEAYEWPKIKVMLFTPTHPVWRVHHENIRAVSK